MHQERTEATIDWLSFTIPWTAEILQPFRKGYAIDALASAASAHVAGWIREKPLHGYPYVVSAADRAGIRVMASEPNHRMGVHVSWSGSALREVNPRAVLRLALNVGATVTRIDLAVDIPAAAEPRAFKDAVNEGRATTRARKAEMYEGKTGWTVYVGSRTSEKYLRVYDKAAESQLPYPCTRIELECKDDYADGIARFVDSSGYDDFPAIIKNFCDFPDIPFWQEHMTSPTLFEGLPKLEKRTDTKRWLMESVAPAAARVLLEDHDFYVSFIMRIMQIAGVGEAAGEADPFEGAADFEPSGRYARIR